MKTRAASVLAVASLGFGVATAIFAGLAYAGVLGAREAAPQAPAVNFWEASQPDASLPAYPALPDADHLPESFTAQQREDATVWLQQQHYVDLCMAEAGYDEWSYAGKWQTGVPGDFHKQWVAGLSGSEMQAAYDVLFGTPDEPQQGVSYLWEENGCQGYAWHAIGSDYPIIF
jgi:hypothetical protein